ncbi:hypothetical protein CK203_047995 [Vitis vinifera]|uniref:Uncharacterized protein n=1 Tax=Vitis vinifera TaxID=29760 RepID=A0A438GH71_VITVI|nr:hypothetical protein CK203_086134 [Vitis vinifera]RVW71535.1 hypothetical protein CK203_047995 [Vitis vinifera]
MVKGKEVGLIVERARECLLGWSGREEEACLSWNFKAIIPSKLPQGDVCQRRECAAEIRHKGVSIVDAVARGKGEVGEIV